jgi:biotin operon repressor
MVIANNNLLGALKPADRKVIEAHLQTVPAATGDILYEPGDEVSHVYFPYGPTLLAFRVALNDGRAIETALVGREGALAGIVSQGRLPAFARAEVQFAGPLKRMHIRDLDAAKAESPAIHNLFARYADCLMAQIFQSVACNAAHTIEQRAAKWLLAAMERTGDARLPLTQDQLAGMLGVGRSYVSRVIQKMKANGQIETRRGALVAPDPAKLDALACDCQAAVKRHFEEILQGVYPK